MLKCQILNMCILSFKKSSSSLWTISLYAFLSSHHFHPFLPALPQPVPPLQQYARLLSASHVNEIVSRSKRLGEVFLIAEEVLISVREGETSQRAGSFHYTPFLLGCVICMWEKARHRSVCMVGHIYRILYLQMFVSDSGGVSIIRTCVPSLWVIGVNA